MDEGRQANTERSFREARTSFDLARESFRTGSGGLSGAHGDFEMRDEAIDLSYIASNEHQAAELRSWERNNALAPLEQATVRIGSAREQGRADAAVSVVVGCHGQGLTDRAERVAMKSAACWEASVNLPTNSSTAQQPASGWR